MPGEGVLASGLDVVHGVARRAPACPGAATSRLWLGRHVVEHPRTVSTARRSPWRNPARRAGQTLQERRVQVEGSAVGHQRGQRCARRRLPADPGARPGSGDQPDPRGVHVGRVDRKSTIGVITAPQSGRSVSPSVDQRRPARGRRTSGCCSPGDGGGAVERVALGKGGAVAAQQDQRRASGCPVVAGCAEVAGQSVSS